MENNKEMDLFDFLKKANNLCLSFIKNIKEKSLTALKFNIKKAYVILPFLIAGFFLAQYLIHPNNRSYNAEFRLKINVSDSHSFYSLIESLNELKEFYPDSASLVLNIDKKEIKKIREMKPAYLIDNNNNGTPDIVDFKDKFVEKDTISIRMDDYLAVRINGKGRIKYEEIQENIIFYLNNEPYAKKATEVYLQIQQQKAEEIKNQISNLTRNASSSNFDSETSQIQVEKNSVSLKKNTSYTKELINLMKLQEEVFTNNQIYNEAVTAISPIVVKTKHGKYFYYFIIIGGMYIISILLSLLIVNKKEIINFIKED